MKNTFLILTLLFSVAVNAQNKITLGSGTNGGTTSGVSSFNDRTGAVLPIAADYSSHYVPLSRTVNGYALSSKVTLGKADVGLGNVDNTSDATKWAATATLTNKTISGSNNTFSNIPQSAVTGLTTDLNNKANVSHTHTRSQITDLS